MGDPEYIYGLVGSSFLEKEYENKKYKVLILADQHDTLPECPNKINIADWFIKKLHTSKILLEEVPRINENKLIELWANSSHTQELKNLFLTNNLISGVDIRPYMIPFSWEVLEEIDDLDTDYNLTMIEFIREIDNFFSLKNKYIISNLSNYNVHILKNTLLGKHFLLIKNKFEDYLKMLNHKKLLNKQVKYLYSKHNYELSILNNILDSIMEWYICGQIEISKDKSIIIHAGLAHTEKINQWLKSHYGFQTKYNEGINNLNEVMTTTRNGCVSLKHIDSQFGGNKKVYYRYLK